MSVFHVEGAQHVAGKSLCWGACAQCSCSILAIFPILLCIDRRM